ncbi:MAG: cytidine deaminase [Actinobacteria bacterium]|nr:cytidine deaminase [Actinomycetota bacterium]
MTEDRIDELVAAAKEVRENAHVPYSRFKVGAALLAGGRVFRAVNVESASYPLSVCAERNAVAAMVAAGERRIDAVAVVTDATHPTPPCGGCRQVLLEFGRDAAVISETLSGTRMRWTVSELLPDAFLFER